MTENKLQLIARTLGGWILTSKGEEKGILAEVLAMVTAVMSSGEEIQTDNDPIFWFDPKGRFCTRAQSPVEINDSMALMAIAEGVPIDMVCRENDDFFEKAAKWDIFQEMKCGYLEGRMRIKELEKELMELKLRQPLPTKGRRFADVDQLKQLLLMAMDLAGMDTLTKGDLLQCMDKAPSWALDIHTEIRGKQ